MRPFLIACALAAGGAALPAQAQTQDEIVVEGQVQQKKKIREFLGALAPGGGSDQIGQFRRQACPLAFGLNDALDKAVTERLRLVAATAGVPLAKPGCAANVMVIFAPEKKPFVEALRKTYPGLFGKRTPIQIRQMASRPGPVVAWHVESRMNEDGTLMEEDEETGVLISETSGAASRLRSPTVPHYLGAVLVIERAAVAGLAVTQVADYAAMRVYARTNPERLPKGADTILSVLEDAKAGGPIALALTQWDLSFLKALYATDNSLYAPRQRSEMVKEFQRDLKGAAEAKDKEP